MNAYLLLDKTDDECDAVLSELTRFSVRTTGCFAAYAALTVDSLEDLRSATERVAAVCPGQVEVLLAVETTSDTAPMRTTSASVKCIDPETGQFDWDCLGSPQPSLGPKAAYFAVAEVSAESRGRESAYEQLAVTGGVTGMVRLADPGRLLVELGATDHDLLLHALEAVAAVAGVERVRAGLAVRPLDVDTAQSD